MPSMEEIRAAKKFKVEMFMSLFEIPDIVTEGITMYAGELKVAIWPSRVTDDSVYVTIYRIDNDVESLGYRCNNNKDDMEKHLRSLLRQMV